MATMVRGVSIGRLRVGRWGVCRLKCGVAARVRGWSWQQGCSIWRMVRVEGGLGEVGSLYGAGSVRGLSHRVQWWRDVGWWNGGSSMYTGS
ncbi:hypothetical protein V6N12_044411 [Hibiscus sabdariffa]|uniref:Uncharacterized protein n=1 Tax=Hibiscus sabdariffa TaxID=183260 RepID=A0ABR2ANS0_9ROSI